MATNLNEFKKAASELRMIQRRGNRGNRLSGGNETLPLLREDQHSEPMPIECLGSKMASAASALSEIVQTDISLAGQCILATAPLIAQGLYDVEIHGRVYPTSASFMTVAESGERKSAMDRIVLQEIRDFERMNLKRYALERRDFEKKNLAFQAALKRIQTERVDSSIQTRSLELELPDVPSTPPKPVMLLDEPTYEALVKHLSSGWPSVGVFSSEGGRLLGGHAMKIENGLKTAAGFSELWDGNPVNRSRAGDGTDKYYGRRCSMHLMVQPKVASLFLGNELFTQQGLMSRILICSPKSYAGNRNYRPINPTENHAVAVLRARHRELLDRGLSLSVDADLELNPRRMTLSNEAADWFQVLFDSFEAKSRANGDYRSILSFASKGPEHALRLAACINMIESDDEVIPLQTLKDAGRLVHWYATEALRLWGMAEDPIELILAEKTLNWLKGRTGKRVSLKELYQGGPRGLRNARAARAIADILVEHGYLRPSVSTEPDGVAPSVWEVVHEQ